MWVGDKLSNMDDKKEKKRETEMYLDSKYL